jgi:hypothetical protein
MTAFLDISRTLSGVVVSLAICGCTAGGSRLFGPGSGGKLPRDARIGLVALQQCGEGYLSRLKPEQYKRDKKAAFLLTCTQLGYPATFHAGLRQGLEKRLGKDLVSVRAGAPFSAKDVLKDAEQLGLEYLLIGDLLAMGETAKEAAILSQLVAMRVADRKVVLKIRIKKTASLGELQHVIDEVADELFDQAF